MLLFIAMGFIAVEIVLRAVEVAIVAIFHLSMRLDHVNIHISAAGAATVVGQIHDELIFGNSLSASWLLLRGRLLLFLGLLSHVLFQPEELRHVAESVDFDHIDIPLFPCLADALDLNYFRIVRLHRQDEICCFREEDVVGIVSRQQFLKYILTKRARRLEDSFHIYFGEGRACTAIITIRSIITTIVANLL